MNLSQMYYFQVVAEEEHISRAAEKLHISQPSLSTTIRRLETELNTSLFERRGRNIYLNNAGRRLLEHIQYIFSQMHQLEKDLEATAFNADHCLSIAVNNSTFLDSWLTRFILNHPDARMTQSIMSEEDMFTALLNEDIDIAMGHFGKPPHGITRHTLLRDEYIVVVPVSHPLADKKYFTFDDIRDKEFVALPSGTANNMIHQIFAQRNVSPHIIFEGQHNMLLKLLSKKDCMLFASRQIVYLQQKKIEIIKQIKSYVDMPELTHHSITDLQTFYDFSICWKSGRELPVMAKNFIESCVENYESYYNPVFPGALKSDTVDTEDTSEEV